MALVDALGTLARVVLLPGERHDRRGVAPLIADIDFAALFGDKAFDIDRLRAELHTHGTLAVIPLKADRKHPIPCNLAMYRRRHLVENFFCNLKEFRRIATRYDKPDTSFSAIIHLAVFHLALK